MPRSKRSQSRHNALVRSLAKEYKAKGYKIEADIKGYDQPGTVRGLRPDLIVEKNGHKTLIEVETPDSLGSKRDEKQQQTFKTWSKGSSTKHYKKVVTEK
jgi:hypothetical protein